MGGAIESRLLIVVGESSGDRHAAHLIEALRERRPLDARGVTGPALERAGVKRLAPFDALAVVGFTGVLSRLPRIWSLYTRLLDEARRFRPDAVVLVDSPGFNLRLGPALRRLGVPVFYYIAPQVWAWHAERAAEMSRWVTRLAVVFPFEEPLFRAAGVETRFVGHPLLEAVPQVASRETFLADAGIPAGSRLLGLLPGSRRSEVRALIPRMEAAAEELTRTRPDLAVRFAIAPGLEEEFPARLRRGEGPIRALSGSTAAIQRHADACVVCSGTATLETALCATPLVVVYRTSWLNHAIARRVVRLDRIGLPNIVAERDVAPELIQDEVTPARMAAAVAPWLDDPAANRAQREALAVVRERLGTPGASARAAEYLAEMLP
jgi:lipid-A-disaccharide synthase